MHSFEETMCYTFQRKRDGFRWLRIQIKSRERETKKNNPKNTRAAYEYNTTMDAILWLFLSPKYFPIHLTHTGLHTNDSIPLIFFFL